MGKIYEVLRRRKAQKPGHYEKRVIKCDCGRAVGVNKKGEIENHTMHSSGRGGNCPMSWKKVELSEE